MLDTGTGQKEEELAGMKRKKKKERGKLQTQDTYIQKVIPREPWATKVLEEKSTYNK